CCIGRSSCGPAGHPSFPTRRSSGLALGDGAQVGAVGYIPQANRVGPVVVDALAIDESIPHDTVAGGQPLAVGRYRNRRDASSMRSEEQTSELQSPYDLVCRLLLEQN